tara:strand:- start:10577 stop:11191 length:615 start_codon:yes stop_codon:yes gene_type:complete
MEDLNWTYILFLLVGIPSSISIGVLAKKDKSLSSLFFSLALFSFVIGVIFDLMIESNSKYSREWGDLIAITFTLSGLFIKIRNSKPVFARFPLYLTLLPFLVLLFYPLVVESEVIKDLLQITFQGGAIVVSILVISVNHFLHKNRGVLLLSSMIFLASFILKLSSGVILPIIFIQISKILFSVGIITTTIGFKRISNLKNNRYQ